MGLIMLVFAVVLSSSGLYSLFNSEGALAANDFSIKTGYYYGNGVSISVSGLGFTPEVVIIKSDTAAGAMLWKTSAMPASATSYLGVATADNTETEITLDADGFTVSAALEANTINVRYTYIAFAGSDCTSGGAMCVGSYSGNTSSTQNITTGFQPDLVIAKRTTALAAVFRTSSMSANHAGLFSAAANDTTGIYFQTINSDGFTVGSTMNTNGGKFYYVAFKNLANKLLVGQFTGDGVDNKEITGVGFEPDFVMVKQNAAVAPAFNTTEAWGDNSFFSTAAANAVNNIQELKADGFQVGTTTNVNALGVVSNYFAFGGASDPVPSGSFFMQSGSYTGTGSAQTIETTFAPDLVIIKGNTTEYAVFGVSILKDQTQYLGSATIGFTGGITSMSDTGFSVGTSTTVNTNGITYEYTAFGNATSPHTGNGAEDFAIGAYTGNGLSPRVIDHLGMAPGMVTVKKPTATANVANWSSSTMSANTTGFFAATADLTDGTGFRSMDSGGFTVGTGASVNTVSVPYLWFAFKEGSAFDAGSYTGNGVAGTNITAPGFNPGLVWVKRSTAVQGVHRSTSATITGANAQSFVNVANAVNFITAFVSGGFTVGTATETNANTGAYQYAAWKSTASATAPNTPTNSSPANAATAQSLNVTLAGSAYADTESDVHTDTQWQIDDDSSFATPVWTRTAGAAEITTSVTSGNGAFANELSGKTELDHNSTYYWRVRYSDGVYSSWSTATYFTTNAIVTPTNSSPSDTATVTTLTPTLSASAFSDPEGGHSATSAQWLMSTSSDFSTTTYDSGTVSYATTLAVPSATLADHTVYYWKVRYADSNSQWSSYSTATRFSTARSVITVNPLFGSTVIDQGDGIKIDAQVKLGDDTVINDATVTIDIYNPSGTKIVTAGSMTYISGSSGIYRYPYTIPSTSGSYLYVVTADSNSQSGYGAANFEVRTLGADVQSIDTIVTAEQTAQDAERTSQAAERTAQGSERTAQAAERVEQEASRGIVEGIQTDVGTLQTNLDVLLGAVIVTQSSVNDAAPTTSSFVTALINTTDDFYNNSVLTFTSGPANGQARRISDYNGTTKTVTLDPPLSLAPVNGNTFTIVKQNVYVEQQMAEHEAADAAFRADTTARLTDIESKIDTVTTTLNGVDADLSTVQTSLNAIRASQLRGYRVALSDIDEIQAGETYRATLTVLDYESNPIDAAATPTISIYDSTRVLAQDGVSMTRLSAGVYEYTYVVDSAATAGLWESIVSVDIDGTANVLTNDYWQVTGAPAQVIINSLSDLTVPSIAANVTITNEGTGAFEYQYAWCVVSAEDDQCGGGNDVYYATAAKLINTGEDFNTTLTATVPDEGDYWFKLLVYYGTDSSGASRSFTAIAESVVEEEVDTTPAGSGHGNTRSSVDASTEDVYEQVQQVRQDLAENAQQLALTLDILGMMNPNLQSLLGVSTENTEKVIDIQNKIADLRAVSTATRRIIEQKSVEPIVETYMKFNSVEIHFLITNPSEESQVVKFKAFLPEEARPEHILDSSGLKVDYDTSSGVYYVSGDIPLGPRETITKKVEMEDIWVFSDEEIQAIKDQANQMIPVLEGTQYEAQGVVYKNDIDATLAAVRLRQEDSYASPQEHIVAYRENTERMKSVDQSLEKMKDLVVQAGAARGVVGQVGGIQTFATWGIIMAIIFGFTMMSVVIFAMWRNQTMLAAAAMGIPKTELKRRVAVRRAAPRSAKRGTKKVRR